MKRYFQSTKSPKKSSSTNFLRTRKWCTDSDNGLDLNDSKVKKQNHDTLHHINSRYDLFERTLKLKYLTIKKERKRFDTTKSNANDLSI
ncbi:hypothetical protein RclHR1_00040019 [Rhizophagus clarus]|uniref:Uncharacterized protein n=1 Tax=Rhizophagus clarus TaxID=94130 RepID=A0A2Z6RE35_9GLOM|nr:hypothetical protein RclHR1_00040019 [Rhizophagus clarus]GES91711.1 hypothetical protein RCL_jg13950.t1 [Rhizophagus clarus]